MGWILASTETSGAYSSRVDYEVAGSCGMFTDNQWFSIFRDRLREAFAGRTLESHRREDYSSGTVAAALMINERTLEWR